MCNHQFQELLVEFLQGQINLIILPGSSAGSSSGRAAGTVSQNGSTAITGGGVLSPGHTTNQSLHSGDFESDDLTSVVKSVYSMCKSTNDQCRRIELKLKGVEQNQVKLTAALKELTDLMKKQEKNSFTIKGSPFEVNMNAVTEYGR